MDLAPLLSDHCAPPVHGECIIQFLNRSPGKNYCLFPCNLTKIICLQELGLNSGLCKFFCKVVQCDCPCPVRDNHRPERHMQRAACTAPVFLFFWKPLPLQGKSTTLIFRTKSQYCGGGIGSECSQPLCTASCEKTINQPCSAVSWHLARPHHSPSTC